MMLWLALLLPPMVASAPERLAILPATVEGPYGAAATAALFEVVSKAADFHQGLELVPYNALFVDGVEPIATIVRDCGSDTHCIARALRLARIDLGLRVIANFALDPPLITLNLIGSADERVIGESVVELEDRSIAEVVAGATERLLDSGSFAPGGRLMVDVEPLDAAVEVQPPAAANTVIAPGRYRVRAAKDGYLERAVDVELAAGAEERVRLALEPVPAPSLVESPWLWTGVGVGVAVIGAVAAVLIVTKPFAKAPSDGDLCIATRAGGC